MKFPSFYVNRPAPVGTDLDLETKYVDQSEADRCSLSYQLERFGMDGLQQKLQQTMNQFGYADTRATKDFCALAEKYAEADSYFQQLPAKIRKEFGHDCTRFYSEIENNPKYMFEKGYISEKFAKELGVLNNGNNNDINNISDLPIINAINSIQQASTEPISADNPSA